MLTLLRDCRETLEQLKRISRTLLGGIASKATLLQLADDAKNAAEMHGPNILTLKGKEIRKQPPRDKIDVIDAPRELIPNSHKTELCVDIMHQPICGLSLLPMEVTS